MSVTKRVELLYAVADEINRRFEDFLQAEMADTGKPHSLASHVDIPRGAANFKVFADIVKNVPTESFEMATPDGGSAISYGLRTPIGVVAVVCPWNLPLLLMTWKVGPALACGNTVIVKPSEETPATATLLGEVMQAVGIPDGVYNVVHGFGPDSAGEFLTRHKDVDGITFTGETRTGEAIMAAAAKGVRPVSFELGGKNAGIVFADADFDKAVAGITRSAFENSGQVCLGTERVYVQRPIFDRFVAAMKAKAEALKIGPPEEPGVGLGPLISAEHKHKVMGYYARARADGATVVTGGGEPRMRGALAEGHWVQPTIWTGLPESASVIREEIFGPCCHIAPFDTIDEAIALANATDYGLATTVWTQNLGTAHRVAAAIEVGLCWVNSWFLRDLRTAFGGAKASGIGREGGVHSLEFYSELRNVMIKL
jgi:aminomuconate-semialdehyde/2-hydroxymuconate-6-semialdehyde dehydrogenase